MIQLRSIVVAVDFSPWSAAALGQAIRIAAWNQSTVHPVHFVDVIVAESPAEEMARFQRYAHTDPKAEAQAIWESFRSGIDGAAALPLEVEIDYPIHGVVRSVRRHAADLLVIGSHGAGQSAGGLGAFALACVRKVPADVLLVRAPHTDRYRHVLACVDFSDTSRLAMEHATLFARQDSAELTALHVFQGPWHILHYRAPTPQAAPHFRQQYADVLRRRLEAFVAGFQSDASPIVLRHQLVDHPHYGSAIAAFANRQAVDLVVLGTRGRTNLRDLLLGSTAERVLRDTQCSILAVKPRGFESPIRD